jgi:signal transduction histidine kinase
MGDAEADPPGTGPDPDRLRRLVHDLRTPLTIVGGFAELLERRGDELPAEERAEFTRRVAEGTRDMRAILDAVRTDLPD